MQIRAIFATVASTDLAQKSGIDMFKRQPAPLIRVNTSATGT